jgi:hypothetical protein
MERDIWIWLIVRPEVGGTKFGDPKRVPMPWWNNLTTNLERA